MLWNKCVPKPYQSQIVRWKKKLQYSICILIWGALWNSRESQGTPRHLRQNKCANYVWYWFRPQLWMFFHLNKKKHFIFFIEVKIWTLKTEFQTNLISTIIIWSFAFCFVSPQLYCLEFYLFNLYWILGEFELDKGPE